MRREAEIQRAILDLLTALGIPAMRMNSRVVMLPGAGGRLRPVRMGGMKGMADILACLPPTGRFLALEVKRPGEKLAPAQVMFLEWISGTGKGIGARVTSCDDVVQLLAQHGWEGK